MKETLALGSSPYNEDCAQLGTEDYEQRANAECRQFIKAIERMHGEAPEGARLRIKSNLHDYGTYLEVVVIFDPEVKEAARWACEVEGNLPSEWNEEDLRALNL